MTIKDYTIQHFPMLMKWLDGHSHPIASPDELPRLGWVVYSDTGVPLAMGFLRLAEGNVAIIDSIAGNPSAKPREMSEAIDILMGKLIQMAKDLRISFLVGATVKNSLVRRTTQKHGFTLSDFKLLVRKT